MGVAWVIPYEGGLSEAELARRLEEGGAERRGAFTVDAIPYEPSPDIGTVLSRFHIAHHSHYPHSSFVVAGPDPFMPQAVADTGIDVLLSKNQAYTVKPLLRMESQGSAFEMEDFFVRIGSVSLGSALKGISIEVEYVGSWVPSQCEGLLSEFCQGLFAALRIPLPAPPDRFSTERFKAGHPATAADTLAQYMQLFHQLRK